MQGYSFNAEVYIIPMESYDLILGVQWLSTLGEIRWNFDKLSMIFMLKGVEMTLQGESWPAKKEQLHALHILNQSETNEIDSQLSLVMPTVEESFWWLLGAKIRGRLAGVGTDSNCIQGFI